TLAAESNGRTVSKSIDVKVSDITSGLTATTAGAKSVTCDGRRVVLDGFSGCLVTIFDTAGHTVMTAEVDTDGYILDFGMHSGVYILGDSTGFASKFIIR
ncbi:MAG: T9SS type A sorting domain-containing protein, partial [Duncaniella sp.]|nr:T9SS type A sorting domain-containing protein [Duncaniella sp.]